MTLEKNLWAWLKKGFKEVKVPKDIRRIENMVSVGDPDVEGCIIGVSFNTELKSKARPKRITTKIKTDLTRDQARWLLDRHKAGGITWILIQIGSAHKAKRYLIPGRLGFSLLEKVLETELAALAINTGNENALCIIKKMALLG